MKALRQEKIRMKYHKYIFIAILLSGAFLRVLGIDFGLPFPLHNDEPVIVNYALAYGRGDLNPHFFKVPPLLSYILFFFYGLYFIIGKLSGLFQGVSDFGYRYLTDPTAFYLIGRIIAGAFFGTFSIGLIYRLSRKIYNIRTALFASLFLAFNFMHVRDSHYIYFDIPLVFFTLLFFLTLYNVHIKGTAKWYLLSGLVLGIAINVKYSAVLMAVPAFAVLISDSRGRGPAGFMLRSLWASAAVLTGLFISSPYMFLDMGFFLDTISRMPFFRPPFWFHLRVSLLNGVGAGMLVFFLAGIIFSLKKKNFYAAVTAFFCFFYYLVLTFSSQMAERYVFPVVPFVLMFAAYAVDRITSGMKHDFNRRTAVFFLCLLLMTPSLVRIYFSEKLFLRQDTRQLSYDWAMENIPALSTIAIDATGPVFPSLPQDRDLILESYQAFISPKFASPEGALDYKVGLISSNPYYPEKFFRIHYLKPSSSDDRFLMTYPELPLKADTLIEEGVDYVILSTALKSESGRDLVREMQSWYYPVKEFDPYSVPAGERDTAELTVVPAASFSLAEMKSRRRYGPLIRIYRRKERDE